MKHLLGTEDLSRSDALRILDTADEFSAVANRQGAQIAHAAWCDHGESLF